MTTVFGRLRDHGAGAGIAVTVGSGVANGHALPMFGRYFRSVTRGATIEDETQADSVKHA